MFSQTTNAIDYSLVQFVDYQSTLTTLTKFSNSETLESLYTNSTNIRIIASDDNTNNIDTYNLSPNKNSINIIMKITDISKSTPIININEFEELED